jgi:hypothetical protein
VIISLDPPQAFPKLKKIEAFARAQRISSEERIYRFQEIRTLADYITMQMFFVIIVSTVQVDFTDAEKQLEHMQAINAFVPLRNSELMSYLTPSYSLCGSADLAGE